MLIIYIFYGPQPSNINGCDDEESLLATMLRYYTHTHTPYSRNEKYVSTNHAVDASQLLSQPQLFSHLIIRYTMS